MRGAIGRPNNFILSNVNKHNPFSLQSTSSFCSGSGRGRGRGRGVPIGSLPFNATPKSPTEPTTESKPESPPTGLGHGRGRPPASPSPALPSFSSFITSVKSGTGRSRGTSESDPSQQSGRPPKPRTFTRTESAESSQPSEPSLPSSILSVLSGAGAGRGKPGVEKPSPPPGSAPDMKEENRHIKAPSRPQVAAAESAPARPKLSREEAVKQAVRILSRGQGQRQGQGGERDDDVRGGGGPGRGRGRVRGRGRGRGRGAGRMFRREMEDKDEGFAAGLYLGDNADGEKLANKIGIENMNKLVEGFEEMSGSVLPSPMEDAYLDALDTNFKFEFEPEYLMEEFGTNPDIDEEPPIPLRDALEKMKPFLMSYEGIQSHEEWEEAINEVMERLPLLKEIVDHYSGPDRVTAKKQQEELERVAKTIPQRAPPSLKRFASRAVLSLQSNPGWGFDKKCQFMDKLAWEASQHYK